MTQCKATDTPGESDHLIYEFVIPSYNWALQRLDSAERRLQGLLLYLATLTFAIPVATLAIAGEDNQLDGLDWTAKAAVGCFILATIVGLFARLRGHLLIADPGAMYERREGDKSREAFRLNRVCKSGDDLTQNRRVVRNKNYAADFMSFLLALEIGFWIWWAYLVLS